jgi:DNA-binding NarL/FixJ family response regulator
MPKMSDVDLRQVDDDELHRLGFAEYTRREQARQIVAEAERNLVLIHGEIERRRAAVAQTNGHTPDG